MRWLLNFLIVLLGLALFLVCLLFLLGNPQAVKLELLVTAWQPEAALGQWLLLFLLGGVAAGLAAGLLLGGVLRLPRRRS